MTGTARGDRLRVLIFTLTPFAREPRALKQLAALRDEYAVTTAGFGPAPDPGVPHIELDPSPTPPPLLRIRGIHALLVLLRQHRLLARFLPRNRDAYARLAPHEWDVVLTHDVATVPVTTRLNSTAGFVVDLHEYAPRQGEESKRWMLEVAPYFRWILRTLVPHARGVTTVGQGIVEEYRREFGIETTLAVNATPFDPDLAPTTVGTPIRLVHSGIPSRARKLEVMIDAVLRTRADVTLDLLLIDDGSAYLQELRDLAGDDPRIRFPDAVPYRELVRTLNGYDVGLSVIAPSTFNLRWCLPNKFFDFVQARLGVVSGPSPEMAAVIKEKRLGDIAADFTADGLAAVLDELTVERVTAWKKAAEAAAWVLSSDAQVGIWRGLIADALAGGAEKEQDK